MEREREGWRVRGGWREESDGEREGWRGRSTGERGAKKGPAEHPPSSPLLTVTFTAHLSFPGGDDLHSLLQGSREHLKLTAQRLRWHRLYADIQEQGNI